MCSSALKHENFPTMGLFSSALWADTKSPELFDVLSRPTKAFSRFPTTGMNQQLGRYALSFHLGTGWRAVVNFPTPAPPRGTGSPTCPAASVVRSCRFGARHLSILAAEPIFASTAILPSSRMPNVLRACCVVSQERPSLGSQPAVRAGDRCLLAVSGLVRRAPNPRVGVLSPIAGQRLPAVGIAIRRLVAVAKHCKHCSTS
ncbi:hypothetical protein C8Q78DRAFT_28506 [Trametes maxima]|nr:hypothetical protein C8Q78DRAFT_28506 [Trametes maxima]